MKPVQKPDPSIKTKSVRYVREERYVHGYSRIRAYNIRGHSKVHKRLMAGMSRFIDKKAQTVLEETGSSPPDYKAFCRTCKEQAANELSEINERWAMLKHDVDAGAVVCSYAMCGA